MEKIMADLLRKTLEELGRYAFPRFKRELSKIQPKEQYERIELESLMGLSRAALAELLCSHYGQPYCVEVTVRVLRAMGRSTLAYTLLHRLTYAVQAQGSIILEGPQKHMVELQGPREQSGITFQGGLQAQSAIRRAGGLQDQSGPKPQGATAGDMPSKKTDWSDEGSSVHGAAASMLPQYTLFGDIDKSTSPSSGRNTRSGAICTSCPTEEDWAEEVKPEIIGDKRGKKEIYRAHFPRAGLFRCVETDLEFLVRTATSIEYKYSFWERHLASGIPPVWMEVGPVFDIHAPPGTVEAIHIPHFLCLGEGKQNTSWMQIAHIVDGNLLVEKPTRVKSFHAVLEDPSFSPMGVIFLSDKLPFIPVHSLVLLYRVFSAADITFHLYLIPNHRGLEKAVDEDEKRSGHSLLVNKPPNTIRPLKFNRWYRVSGPSRAEINPKELKFVYLALDRRQLFTEIYTKDMEEGMQLTLTKVVQEGKRDCRLLWGTLLRAGRESRMQVCVTGSERLGGCPNVGVPWPGKGAWCRHAQVQIFRHQILCVPSFCLQFILPILLLSLLQVTSSSRPPLPLQHAQVTHSWSMSHPLLSRSDIKVTFCGGTPRAADPACDISQQHSGPAPPIFCSD
ncbi:uncharacterized protein LOC121062508 isoform X3 [Cygnus olor]|uniref:uncharacterized protein LOC121062508 isoform X3 n=1 Tax=Cygnus olor TaxID=8869 RepID=UPI001ADEB2E5|nr:uncharacterized protein LOC121062508 isoform X3 [Cygnus olor]